MAVKIDRLSEELTAAGVIFRSISITPAPDWSPDSPYDLITRATDGIVVGIVWANETLRTAHLNTATSVIQIHNGDLTETERLEIGLPRIGRVVAVLAIRASSQWAAMPVAKKNKIQTLIDQAAADVIALLS